jgi:hypothetical protein
VEELLGQALTQAERVEQADSLEAVEEEEELDSTMEGVEE